MYVQRYLPHLPAAGEVVIFDRSYYNRAGVERVMGFCDEKIVRKFLEDVPKVEKSMVDSGIILIKYWLEVSDEEQTRRLTARIDDARKTWKLTPMDLKSYSKWYDYSRARDDMFKYTHTAFAPWIVADSNDKKRARLNIIRDLLSRVPYKSAPREKVRLPKRTHDKSYREPKHVVERVAEKY
jgi:polyphosphate kinase 2 (PPK2 family)